MTVLRKISRLALMILWSIILMVPAAISFIGLSKWQRVKRGAFWATAWAKGIAWIAGVKTVVHGEIPQESGVLLVSNHLGYLDILAHASNFKLRFTPNDGIRKWFFAGQLVALSAPIWIDRKHPRKAAEYAAEFRDTMANGVSLLVYPEGTSTDGKRGMLNFKSTVFASLPPSAPIVPMVLFYHETPADIPAAWFDDTPFSRHGWRVLGLKKVQIDLYLLPPVYAGANEERKQLAARVREKMLEEYRKHV